MKCNQFKKSILTMALCSLALSSTLPTQADWSSWFSGKSSRYAWYALGAIATVAVAAWYGYTTWYKKPESGSKEKFTEGNYPLDRQAQQVTGEQDEGDRAVLDDKSLSDDSDAEPDESLWQQDGPSRLVGTPIAAGLSLRSGGQEEQPESAQQDEESRVFAQRFTQLDALRPGRGGVAGVPCLVAAGSSCASSSSARSSSSTLKTLPYTSCSSASSRSASWGDYSTEGAACTRVALPYSVAAHFSSSASSSSSAVSFSPEWSSDWSVLHTPPPVSSSSSSSASSSSQGVVPAGACARGVAVAEPQAAKGRRDDLRYYEQQAAKIQEKFDETLRSGGTLRIKPQDLQVLTDTIRLLQGSDDASLIATFNGDQLEELLAKVQ